MATAAQRHRAREDKAARRRKRLARESEAERARRAHRLSDRVVVGSQMLRELVDRRKAPKRTKQRERKGMRAEA